MAAILKDEPPAMSSLQPVTPPMLDRVVKKCLAKEPDKRWQAASDLCEELKWIGESGAETSKAALREVKPPAWRQAVVSGLAVLVAVAITGLAVWNLKPSPPSQSPARSSLCHPAIGYVAVPTSRRWLFLPMESNSPMPPSEVQPARFICGRWIAWRPARSPGTEGASQPFFSPDGQWIGFFAGGKLKKISVSGGAAVTLGDAVTPIGASWGSQGTIVFDPPGAVSLCASAGRGRRPAAANSFRKRGKQPNWPEFLPGGKAVLFAAGNSAADLQIAVQSLATGQRRNLVRRDETPLRSLRASDLCARDNSDGCAL